MASEDSRLRPDGDCETEGSKGHLVELTSFYPVRFDSIVSVQGVGVSCGSCVEKAVDHIAGEK